MDLAEDILLSSLIGVIAHVMREEPSYPKGDDRPVAILTSILLYLVNHGCQAHWKRERQDSTPS
jgi:hypothetical protein